MRILSMAKRYEVDVHVTTRQTVSVEGKLGKQARVASAAGFTAFLLVPNRSAGIPDSLHLKFGS